MVIKEVTLHIDVPANFQPLSEEFKKISVENKTDDLTLLSYSTELFPSQENSLSLLSNIYEEIHITEVKNLFL